MADTTLWATDLPTGASDFYYRITNPAGLIWNGSSYVTYVVANLATYRVAATETPSGSGRYSANFPPSSPANTYTWALYRGTGIGSDTRWGGPDSSYWDGTTFGNVASVTGNVAGNVLGNVNGNLAGNVNGSVAGSVASVASAVSLPTVPPTGYGGATILQAGTAQAGSATTITLSSGAGSVDGQYVFCTVAVVDGTGSGQANVISAYNGTTKVATVTNPWATVPDATSEYQILPQGAVIVGQIAGGERTVTQDWQGVGGLTVTNETTGQPILGATVTAYLATAYATSGPSAPVIASTTTDANGHWTLSLSPANYTLVFAYGTESKSLVITVN